MRDATDPLSMAIAELQCISPSSPARLTELRALAIAQREIGLLIDSCITDLRSSPTRRRSWSDIGRALDITPEAARKRFSRS